MDMELRLILKESVKYSGAVLSALLLTFVFSACLQQYDPRDKQPADNSSVAAGGLPLASLKGTIWYWNSSWGYRTLTFDPSDMVVAYLGQDGDDYTVPYIYNSATKRGKIDYYGEAGFEVSADNNTMYFIEWQKFGHGCDYTRYHDE